MAKITINPLSGSHASVTAINARFQQLEDVLNDDVLWRDGFVAEPNQMEATLDMNGFSIINSGAFNTTDLYLGAYPIAPTEFAPGVPLGPNHVGALYFNSTDNSVYVWTGVVWSSLSSAATTAAAVSITDTDGHYTGTDVETALKELGDSTGASIIGITDTSNNFAATNVEDALEELFTTGAQSQVEDLSFSVPFTGNVVLTALPTWANKITITISQLVYNLTNFQSFLFVGPGNTQGSGIGHDNGVFATAYETGNSNRCAISFVDTGLSDWWGGTIILTRQPGTFTWLISINMHETANTGTGSGPFQYVSGSYVHLGTGELTQVDFGNNSQLNQGDIKVLYEA